MLKGGLTLAFIASSLLLVALFFTIASNGVIATTASSLAMQSQGHRAGSTSAVIGVTMFPLGAITVPINGIGGTSVLSMTATIFGCFMLAILMFIALAKKPLPQMKIV